MLHVPISRPYFHYFQDIVDMPDRLIYLFINLVHQNGGRLSSAKRNHFSRLSDERIARIENAVRMAFNIDN